jgi:hypothetical protein
VRDDPAARLALIAHTDRWLRPTHQGHLPLRRSAPTCLTADLARCACSAIDGGIPRLPNAELRGTHSYLRMMAPIGVLADTRAAARPTRST